MLAVNKARKVLNQHRLTLIPITSKTVKCGRNKTCSIYCTLWNQQRFERTSTSKLGKNHLTVSTLGSNTLQYVHGDEHLPSCRSFLALDTSAGLGRSAGPHWMPTKQMLAKLSAPVPIYYSACIPACLQFQVMLHTYCRHSIPSRSTKQTHLLVTQGGVIPCHA